MIKIYWTYQILNCFQKILKEAHFLSLMAFFPPHCKSNHAEMHWNLMAAGLLLYQLYLLLLVISLINARQFIANQQIKTAFTTNGIMLGIIHWKISIILFVNSQKPFTVQTMQQTSIYVVFRQDLDQFMFCQIVDQSSYYFWINQMFLR